MSILTTTVTIESRYCLAEDCPTQVNASIGYDYRDDSVGDAGGWYCTSAEIINVDLGGEPLERYELIKAFGRAEIERIESLLPEIIMREMDEGKHLEAAE